MNVFAAVATLSVKQRARISGAFVSRVGRSVSLSAKFFQNFENCIVVFKLWPNHLKKAIAARNPPAATEKKTTKAPAAAEKRAPVRKRRNLRWITHHIDVIVAAVEALILQKIFSFCSFWLFLLFFLTFLI